MFDKIKNLFNRIKNKYLGTYKDVDLYYNFKYKISSGDFQAIFSGKQLFDLLSTEKDMFKNVEIIEVIK